MHFADLHIPWYICTVVFLFSSAHDTWRHSICSTYSHVCTFHASHNHACTDYLSNSYALLMPHTITHWPCFIQSCTFWASYSHLLVIIITSMHFCEKKNTVMHSAHLLPNAFTHFSFSKQSRRSRASISHALPLLRLRVPKAPVHAFILHITEKTPPDKCAPLSCTSQAATLEALTTDRCSIMLV